LQAVNNDLAEAFKLDRPRGALVAQILPDSPAASAGFKQGDIILRYGGEPVEDSSQLPRMIGVTPVGKTVPMSILRNGEPLEIKATIARLEAAEDPVSTMDEHSEPRLGSITVADLSNEQRRDAGRRRAAACWSPRWTRGRPRTRACIQTISSYKSITSAGKKRQPVRGTGQGTAQGQGGADCWCGGKTNRFIWLCACPNEESDSSSGRPMNPNNCLDFEKPIAELEAMLKELRHLSAEQDLNISDEIARLEAKSKALTESIFASLTPWQISQIARHPLAALYAGLYRTAVH
jgi:hypothetical protein